jgi:paraquat-inducible protein B
MVAKGFRGQLRTGNLLTGQRYVALDFFPKAKAAPIGWNRPIPELPTQPGSLDSLQEKLVAVVDTLQGTLQRADRLIAHIDQEVVPEVAPTLRDAQRTLARANAILSSDAPVQMELRDTLREVERAAAAVRDLADTLEQQPQAVLIGKKASK